MGRARSAMIAGLRVGPFGDRPGGETAPRDEWSAEWVYPGFGAGSRRQPGHVRTRRDTYCTHRAQTGQAGRPIPLRLARADPLPRSVIIAQLSAALRRHCCARARLSGRHNILGDYDIPWATPCRMKSQMTRRQPCLMRQWRSRFLQSPAWEECRRARRRRPRRSAISPKGAAPGTSTGAQVKPRGLVPAQPRPGTPHTGLRQGTTRHHRARAIDGVGKLATLSPA